MKGRHALINQLAKKRKESQITIFVTIDSVENVFDEVVMV